MQCRRELFRQVENGEKTVKMRWKRMTSQYLQLLFRGAMSGSGNEISSRGYGKASDPFINPMFPSFNSGLPFILFHKLILQMQMS